MDLDTGIPAHAGAMEMALGWLEVRGRSRAQIEARLRSNGVEVSLAEAVGARLSELGILDDRAFAEASVATGLRRGFSRVNLQQQLESQGVAPGDVTWALEESSITEPDDVRALQLAKSWVRAHPAESGPRAFRRLGGLLLRKGFEEELARDVCRALLGEMAEAPAVSEDAGVD